MDPPGQDCVHRVLLAFQDQRGAAEGQPPGLHPGGLEHGAVRCERPAQHREATIRGVGVRDVTDAARAGIGVQRLPPVDRGERLDRAHSARCRVEEFHRLSGRVRPADVPVGEKLRQACRVDGVNILAQQSGPVELTEDGRYATGPVDVLHVVLGARRHLAQARHRPGDLVDVVQGDVHAGLDRGGQQVQDGVGRTAHGHVHGEGVGERGAGRDRPWQDAVVVLVVPPLRQVHNGPPGLDEQVAAGGGGGEGGAVAGQGEPKRLGQAVHRVGGEHARTRPAGRARRAFHSVQLGVVDRGVH